LRGDRGEAAGARGGFGDIKKKREEDKEIEEVVWEKTLTPPLPLPYRGGESTANGIVFQKKSYATFPSPQSSPRPLERG